MLLLDYHYKEITEQFGFCIIPVHLGLVTSDYCFLKSGSLFVESSMSWVYKYDPKTKAFHHFPYNENPTSALNTPNSNAAYHFLMLLTSGKKFTHAYESSRSPHASMFH